MPQEGQLSIDGREEAGLLPDLEPPGLLVLRVLGVERCPLDLPSAGRLSSKRCKSGSGIVVPPRTSLCLASLKILM